MIFNPFFTRPGCHFSRMALFRKKCKSKALTMYGRHDLVGLGSWFAQIGHVTDRIVPNWCFLLPHCTQSTSISSWFWHCAQSCCKHTRLVPFTVAVSDYLVSWVVSKSLNTYSALSLDGNLIFKGFIYHRWSFWSDNSLHSTVCNTRDHSAWSDCHKQSNIT